MSNTTDDSQPLITHLVELRNRLLRCVICILVVFVALVYFSNDIYHFVAAPLTAVMPKGATMIATNIQTPFFTPIKLTAIVSVFISVPGTFTWNCNSDYCRRKQNCVVHLNNTD